MWRAYSTRVRLWASDTMNGTHCIVLPKRNSITIRIMCTTHCVSHCLATFQVSMHSIFGLWIIMWFAYLVGYHMAYHRIKIVKSHQNQTSCLKCKSSFVALITAFKFWSSSNVLTHSNVLNVCILLTIFEGLFLGARLSATTHQNFWSSRTFPTTSRTI